MDWKKLVVFAVLWFTWFHAPWIFNDACFFLKHLLLQNYQDFFFLHFFSFLIVINVRVGKGRKQWSSWHGSPVAKNYTVTVAELNDDCFPGPLDGVLYMPSWHFVVVQICVTEVPFSLSPTIFSTALRHSNCYYLVPMDNKFFQIRLNFSSKKCT